ncbi:Tethering factor for nuclear proteasome sts1 [Yamadazyma tenuis]|uniref:Tethering factor for nuclear proteasome STS1 n=1 Tax=Candida tenuis (strain ATCC 10573 / BCRC 21748 / CBS 615 / JCM 9827 / NBRC 10315 / NRRL Y-1498 / VKM Y-70) TaxID=590646 RepID=G3BCW3_CANTC|nr:Cut8-domain-containing protein [Yamadazyma tenuis ATCC 10573]EGV60224.1 Cut8-domain-containing protein [Yamadazyma tenuis ATCC 10573]WEJ94535.1 Tethering factor for nuclear proteasome sts1 [Yamadazyma tenuis]
MSKSVGFQWGVKSNVNKPAVNSKHLHKTGVKKRRYDDEKPKVNTNTITKRTKFPIIKGERLPINRLIETLNRSSINLLLTDLVRIHPEICHTIYDLQPKVEVEDAMTILNTRVEDIHHNLPYKGDLENDYSYLRVKPYLNEFLNCLSDYILNYLPPVETNLIQSLQFIDYATNIIMKLPSFRNNEYKYIKLKCYEQMSNTWLIVLNNLIDESEDESEVQESLFNLIKVINDLDLKEKLSTYNHISVNKFDKVLEFINEKSALFNNLNNTSSSLGDLITVDYSNYSLAAPPST